MVGRTGTRTNRPGEQLTFAMLTERPKPQPPTADRMQMFTDPPLFTGRGRPHRIDWSTDDLRPLT